MHDFFRAHGSIKLACGAPLHVLECQGNKRPAEVALHLELTVGWWSRHCVGGVRDVGMVELKLVGDSEMVHKADHSQA